MKHILTVILFVSIQLNTIGQVIIGPKGTKITLDSSKWKLNGNDIYNKNSGKIGMGTASPTAQLHTTSDVRFEGIGTNTTNTKILTSDALGNISTRTLSNLLSTNALTSINGLTNSVQTFSTGTTGNDFNISSSGSGHTFNIPSASAINRGLLLSSDWNTFNNKENLLTFSTGMTRSGNTISINTSQNINTLSNLTSNGLIKTSGGAGNLSTATAGIDYSAGTASLATGILKSSAGTGTLSIASASDFPILNQNTTGNAATVTTNANLTGPVTSVGNQTSITANAITNAMLDQVPSKIFKGRTTTGNGNVEDLTPAQATAMLNQFTSTTQGVVPASGGGTSTFLRADGVFAAPTGNANKTLITLASDVTNNNATGNTLQDLTGLSFNVTAGVTYRFYAMIPYTSQNASNGSRWTITGPSSSFIGYVSRYADNPESINYCGTFNLPAGCSNLSNLTGNVAVLQGVIIPSANGTVQFRFASELGGTGITAKAGASLEYW